MAVTYYFAYGSNMDRAQMRQRCPNARWLVSGAAHGWRFRINSRGVATMVPERESTVYGIVWCLTNADEQKLDWYEGLGIGLYCKSEVGVQLQAGNRLEALVYLAEDQSGGNARSEYMECIIAAAVKNGFPSHYITELRTWLPTEE